MKIPKPKTRDEYVKEKIDSGEKEQVLAEAMLGFLGASSSLTRMPGYNDPNEIYDRAKRDIRNRDYSEMMDYFNSMLDCYDLLLGITEGMADILEKQGWSMTEEGVLVDPDGDEY